MIAFPNCKINLGLHITAKRDDGFHNLETVFFPVKIFDILEILPKADIAQPASSSRIIFNSTGINLDTNPTDNICCKAYELLSKDFPELLPPINMHLHKTIPAGAGLGGGSADGAFTLALLNKTFNLQIPTDRLMHYALQLGSDCPFFLLNQPAFATGRGEKLSPVQVDLSPYKLLLINPRIPISTREAFANLTPSLPSQSIADIIIQSPHSWKKALKNDFEKTIFPRFPEIESIKNNLYQAGAIYASMSGSGSTVYAIFPHDSQIKVQFPSHYFISESSC